MPLAAGNGGGGRAAAALRPPVKLDNPHIYTCAGCRTHIATHDNLISKSFQGRHGRAFLLTSAINVDVGEKEDRVLMTGLHTVADIFCSSCSTRLGWKYVEAFEPRCARSHREGAVGGTGKGTWDPGAGGGTLWKPLPSPF